MNAKGRKTRYPLSVCPRCGMDSGNRKVSETANEKNYVVCETCGYLVGPFGDMPHAVKAWNRGIKHV